MATPITNLDFALFVPRTPHNAASCAHKKTQHHAGPRDSVLLIVPAKSRCVTPVGLLALTCRASRRRRSFAKAMSPAQRILHFCPAIASIEISGYPMVTAGSEGTLESRIRPQSPEPTSILLAERSDAAATALPRPGTKANPVPHAPDTRRQAVGEATLGP
jgi:hypothetical protein